MKLPVIIQQNLANTKRKKYSGFLYGIEGHLNITAEAETEDELIKTY